MMKVNSTFYKNDPLIKNPELVGPRGKKREEQDPVKFKTHSRQQSKANLNDVSQLNMSTSDPKSPNHSVLALYLADRPKRVQLQTSFLAHPFPLQKAIPNRAVGQHDSRQQVRGLLRRVPRLHLPQMRTRRRLL